MPAEELHKKRKRKNVYALPCIVVVDKNYVETNKYVTFLKLVRRIACF